jgi:hypothetical protein
MQVSLLKEVKGLDYVVGSYVSRFGSTVLLLRGSFIRYLSPDSNK